jgi:hypothetical protein
MSEAAQILEALNHSKSEAAEELSPLVCDEWRRLAAGHPANERPGQTLQPPAPDHEAYVQILADALAARGALNDRATGVGTFFRSNITRAATPCHEPRISPTARRMETQPGTRS